MDSVKYILKRFIGSSILISLLFIILNIAGFLLFSYMIFVSKYSVDLDTSDSREIKSNLIMLEENLILKDGKYSLQGTTQGNGLTGGLPPVRFSM